MQILFYTPEYSEAFEANISNLMQLMDFCKANKQELYLRLKERRFSYTVYKEGADTAFSIRPEMIQSNLEDYDLLVIAPRLEGEIGAIAGALIAAGWAAWAAYTVAVVVVIGVIVALGYLMQALSPNKKLDGSTDPSEMSRIFNGVPNIIEQGGSVPVVVGNCLFGGVRIGLKFEVALTNYADTRIVNSFAEAMAYPSSWLKIN